MLSPNARRFVADSRGGPKTRTLKLQFTESINASVTVHATLVIPIGKAAPDGGEHAKLNGSTPPDACGWANVMRTGPPVNDCVTTGAGHDTVGCGAALRLLVGSA